jgi:methylenetetrahydrofolate--tRNA-(uracil-5-)-methyltransferase
MSVHIIGAGLAGSSAAFYLAERGIPVVLREMRPALMTPAHKTDQCAELVCSNSFKSKSPTSAPGMLKAEMSALDSLVLRCAGQASVPGGEAMSVDREVFADSVTRILKSHPLIQFVAGEASEPEKDAITLIATGPLTSDNLSNWLARATGEDDLYFYDAIAPIIDASTIDMNSAFIQNRYDKGEEEAYVNCPMTEAEYYAFIDALTSAEKVPPKSFEKEKFFQGCQPIEAISAAGRESLRFGPMKPVGLTNPRSSHRPYAVVQLRPENRAKTAYNMVGFQTKLKYGEQSRVFRMIPALKNAEFLRMGSIHRNTYVVGPKVLRQITGVEGYLESSACGLLAAIFVEQRMKGLPHRSPPANTAMGALLRHVTASDPKNYQPANAHFGLFDPSFFDGLTGLGREDSRRAMAQQAIANFGAWLREAGAVG